MMKKIIYGLTLVAAMASCTDDYTDWVQPQSIDEEEAKTVALSVSAASDVDLAGATDSVQLFVPTVDVSDEALSTYIVDLYADADAEHVTLTADNEGRVAKADLQKAVVTLCGARPTERTLSMDIIGLTTVNGQSIKNVATSTIKVTPEAPFIDPAGYYVVGNIDGWTCTRVDDYHMVNNGGDVYENPEFTIKLAAVDDLTTYEIKIVPASAFNAGGTIDNWDIALSALPDAGEAANEGKFSYSNEGGNIKFDAVEGAKSYTITANLLEGTYKVEAVVYDQFVYFIGATDGWAASDQKLESPAYDGIYTGYVYVADPNEWGMDFKFQRVAGSWDNEINYETYTVSGDLAQGGGTNFNAAAGEGVYFVTLDMVSGTINAIKITNMNLVGDFNGWQPDDDAQQMTWNATDFCYEITSAGVTASGWKFTANNGWGINLGYGESNALTELVAGGGNIDAVGTTIKLYPTRKTSDKIYCTVE